MECTWMPMMMTTTTMVSGAVLRKKTQLETISLMVLHGGGSFVCPWKIKTWLILFHFLFVYLNSSPAGPPRLIAEPFRKPATWIWRPHLFFFFFIFSDCEGQGQHASFILQCHITCNQHIRIIFINMDMLVAGWFKIYLFCLLLTVTSFTKNLWDHLTIQNNTNIWINHDQIRIC